MSETIYDAASDATQMGGARKLDWRVSLILGALAALAGIFAITFPLFATVAFGLFFAAMLIVSGVIQSFDALRRKEGGDLWMELGLGILSLLAGVAFFFLPGLGILSLTVVFGIFFILDAILRFTMSRRPRAADRRWWVVAGSLLSLFLGLFILFGLPETAFYTIGLLWGVHALFLGAYLTSNALSLRKANGE